MTDDAALVERHIVVRRTARYVTLGDTTGEIDDLWIACHGYGQLASEFLTSMRKVAARGRLLVAPEGLSRFYVDRASMTTDPPPRVGASWMTREDRDVEIQDQVEYLSVLLSSLRQTVGEGARLRLLGFSQGVATVCRWVARSDVRPDELILWAGTLPQELELAAFSARLAGARVTMAFGSRDLLVLPAVGETQLERLTSAGIDARLVSFEGGHRLDDATLIELAAQR